MLYATVRNRKIHVKKPDTVIQNGINVDWLKLEMDDEWAEMESIVCVFVNRYTEEADEKLTEKEISKEMLHTFGEKVLVPWECLEKTGMLSVSCTGYVGGEKVMTTMYPDSYWNVVQNGPVSGDETIEPTPSLYNQILAAAGEATAAAIAANQAKDQLLQDKENGVFDGADGKNAKVSVGSTKTGSEGSEAEVYATGTEQDLKLNFVIPRGAPGRDGRDGKDGGPGQPGRDGVGILSITQTTTSTADGGSNVLTVEMDDGETSEFVVRNGSRGSTGATGKRGNSIFCVSVSPSYSPSAFRYYYRVADLKAEFGVSEIYPGEMIFSENTGRIYVIDSISESSSNPLAYLGKSYSVTGTQGPAGPAGSDANVTTENIKNALGYTPADAEVVSNLSAEIGDIDTALDGILAIQNSYINGGGA